MTRRPRHGARQVHGERGHSGGGATLGGRRRTVSGRGRQSLDPPAAPGHTQLSNREQPHGADQHGEQRESRAQPAALVFDGQRAAEGRQGEQQQGPVASPSATVCQAALAVVNRWALIR